MAKKYNFVGNYLINHKGYGQNLSQVLMEIPWGNGCLSGTLVRFDPKRS